MVRLRRRPHVRIDVLVNAIPSLHLVANGTHVFYPRVSENGNVAEFAIEGTIRLYDGAALCTGTLVNKEVDLRGGCGRWVGEGWGW